MLRTEEHEACDSCLWTVLTWQFREYNCGTESYYHFEVQPVSFWVLKSNIVFFLKRLGFSWPFLKFVHFRFNVENTWVRKMVVVNARVIQRAKVLFLKRTLMECLSVWDIIEMFRNSVVRIGDWCRTWSLTFQAYWQWADHHSRILVSEKSWV